MAASSLPGDKDFWTRSVQWVTVFLLGMAAALMLVHWVQMSRWGTRPLELRSLSTRLDLNRSEKAALMQIPGVGPVLAERIDLHRREKGRFQSVDELLEVEGIGRAALERMRPWLTVQTEDAENEEKAELEPARLARKTPVDSPPAKKKEIGSKKIASLRAPIPINQANQEELQRLPGIGPKLSQRILDERQKAPFKSVEDLRRVPGIGPKTLERLRPYVTVKDE